MYIKSLKIHGHRISSIDLTDLVANLFSEFDEVDVAYSFQTHDYTARDLSSDEFIRKIKGKQINFLEVEAMTHHFF